MSNFQNKFLNGATLSTSTGVFNDALLTVEASNGFYREGTIVRIQTNGVLGPILDCPSCSQACGTVKLVGTNVGTYSVSVSLGTSLGASRVRLLGVSSKPMGVDIQFNNSSYNKFSSTNNAYLGVQQAPSPIVMSYFRRALTECSSYTSGSATLANYIWDESSSSFIVDGNTTATVYSNEKLFNAGGNIDQGDLIMYLPKPSPSNLSANIIINIPCAFAASTNFEVEIGCPSSLSSVNVSLVASSSADACNLQDLNQLLYSGPVSGSSGQLAINDWVFSDSNASVLKADGFYKVSGASFDWIQVENGIIIATGGCN
jgi:hypothetical protein